MASLFEGYNPKTLENVLGQQAQTLTAQTKDEQAQKRKRAVAQQAASGRLMSGVSDYPLTDIDTETQSRISGIQSDLSTKLGQIPSEDWLNQQSFGRNYDLASLIGRLNKPSTLEQIFQGIGAVGPTAAMMMA